jgi:hypothetical protein
MSDELMAFFNEMWGELRDELEATKALARKASLQPQAEEAGGVRNRYAALADFPAAGQLGRLAVAVDTAKLYFDNGATWQEVTLT